MPKRDKDLERFTELYMAYYPMVLGTAIKKIGNQDQAEDICQEVFSLFFEKMKDVEKPKSWLMGTLKFVTFRHYRSKNRDTSDIDELFGDDSPAYVNGFRDTRILIREAMDALDCTDNEQVLLDLVAVHGFTYKNAADILGITRRQAEYSYGQLVKKIMDYLQKKGIKDIEELL